ncbi:TIGR02680 family protein [Gordonia sp. TBRC 11910]|uniref:TIGR02680 family protein n=1 Tax=Gordonia asplenii TaxID=2725283 RepID=A0A848KZL5_9ACTN|nr:TIGR02680 family protein [Gordonia asplenii]NMO01843.1 TIGR02680 family protein [Gordonia asplenii]
MTGQAHSTPQPGTLPTPVLNRWQPLRLGLVDLFYYDDEQFWFHDGRLLLRGNNGTGKSKVLALTLPFLLDGSLVSRRVEPDADPKKRMDWNLLLGGAHPNPERTGYTWAEFGRIDEDGVEQFVTIGIGLKAASGRGIVKHWFFVTSRRIGDLSLVDENRSVLSLERLRDELVSGGSGQVFTKQESYRRVVDETMFNLGPDRYAALIDLLIQLRQPQLSKRPDEKALSAALTEALAPPDQALIADVAESFRSLDEERAGIATARQTLSAAEAFLRHYRVYASIASRRTTTAVREKNSEYERVGRDLIEAEAQRTEATATCARLDSAHTVAEDRQRALRGQEQALRTSPEMKDAESLDQASRAAVDAEQRSAKALEQAQESAGRADRYLTQQAEAQQLHEERADAVDRAEHAALASANAAGLAVEHPTIARDENAAERQLRRRREQASHVRGLLRDADSAATAVVQLRTELDRAEADAARRAETLHAEHAAVESVIHGYRDALRAVVAELKLINIDSDVDEFVEHGRAWAESLDGESPARTELDRAASTATERATRDLSEADADIARLTALHAELVKQIEHLEAGHDVEPAATPGRDPAARVDRPGAPLWRVVDFATDLDDDARARTEAALTSAGLLDAWIFPDGTVETSGDVVLGPAGPVASPSARTLLAAAAGPDDDVTEDAVSAVLDRIGRGVDAGAAIWIDDTGRWGAGPARGQWSKPTAEFVGAGAREERRRSQVAELQRQVRDVDLESEAARARVAQARRTITDIAGERDRYPTAIEHDVRAAHGRVAAATREVEVARTRLTEVREQWVSASALAEESLTLLREQADELSVPTTASEIDALEAAINAYDIHLVKVRSAATLEAAAHDDLVHAAERAVDAAEIRERHDFEYRVANGLAVSLRAKYDELFATVGASVAELQERLKTLAEQLREVADDLAELMREQMAAATSLGTSEQRVIDLTERREQAAQVRAAAIEALHHFIETGLLRVALPDLDVDSDIGGGTVSAAVGLARRVDAELSRFDDGDDGWAKAQQRVSTAWTELTTQMSRHGHIASMEQRGEVNVARVRYLQEDIDVDLLAVRLSSDVADRERLLSAREREILENSLVNEAAAHLHELLRTAQEQIDTMNRELAQRKTSTGMQLRVLWRERGDGPPGLIEARKILDRSDAMWTADDRSAVGDFLQAQIAEVREADPTGGWQEHLARALDYRQWHRFAIERNQNGNWKSASGPASGGERALVVSIPLFAAASAHYNSAGQTAPRLILLDEAFAGVDDDSRAKSLGLLATFDLDVVMTSEREWGCYPQVPGLSIAQLSRVEGIDAVGVTRWRWDGSQRRRIAEVDDAARAGRRAQAASPDESTLFD